MSDEPFIVVPGDAVASILSRSHDAVLAAIRDAYLLHHNGRTVNPASQFLRFPDCPDARIIALPARLHGDTDLAGVKWISSFPANVTAGNQRASAVLILNDTRTGHPVACLEASRISAARTAASAALAAETLRAGADAPVRLAVIGAGVIARAVVEFALARHWPLRTIAVCDLDHAAADALVTSVRARADVACRIDDLPGAVAAADVVVFCTNALSPWLSDPALFEPGTVVLHVSLRDLSPAVILRGVNVLDDIDHCLTAATSVHLTEQQTGNRDFVHGTLAQVLLGEVDLPGGRPRVFSPFGLGVLDLAVGALVLDAARHQRSGIELPGFLGSTRRW